MLSGSLQFPSIVVCFLSPNLLLPPLFFPQTYLPPYIGSITFPYLVPVLCPHHACASSMACSLPHLYPFLPPVGGMACAFIFTSEPTASGSSQASPRCIHRRPSVFVWWNVAFPTCPTPSPAGWFRYGVRAFSTWFPGSPSHHHFHLPPVLPTLSQITPAPPFPILTPTRLVEP